MWSEKAFDDTPSDEYCSKIHKFVDFLQNPLPVESSPVFSQVNEFFINSQIKPYSNDLSDIIKTSDNITSGWLPEIQSFWVSNGTKLFIVNNRDDEQYYTYLFMPPIAVGFLNNHIVVSHEDSLSLFSYPKLEAIKTTFSLPKNVKVTHFHGDIAGCSDGLLRRVVINPDSFHVSVTGFSSSRNSDPVSAIISRDQHLVTLSVNSAISVFDKSSLQRYSSTKFSSIVAIWFSSKNIVCAINKNSVLFKLNIEQKSHPEIEETQSLIPRNSNQKATFNNGLLYVVDGIRSNFDRLYVVRLVPSPIYSVFNNFGMIFSFGDSDLELYVLSSRGITTIFEKLMDNENIELWRFANLLNLIWETPISEAAYNQQMIHVFNELAQSSFKVISTLAQYVLCFINDYLKLLYYKSDYCSVFKNMPVHDFFLHSRQKIFSRLRKISLEISLNQEDSLETTTNDPIISLIEQASSGDVIAEQRAVDLIKSTKGTLPSAFPVYIDYLIKHGYYEELLEVVNNWADHILSDSLSSEYESSGFTTTDIDCLASYHLRNRVMTHIIPYLGLAVDNPNGKAGISLKKGLQTFGESFQRFVTLYFEKCSSEIVIFFDYPGLLNRLRVIKSKHIASILEHHHQYKDSYEQLIEDASEVSEKSIDDRILLLQKAVLLRNHIYDVSEAEKLLQSAQIMKEYIENHPNTPNNLFSINGNDLIDKMYEMGEFSLAFQLMCVYGRGSMEILRAYVETANSHSLKTVVSQSKIGKCAYSEEILAQEIFEIHNHEKAIPLMIEVGIDPKYVFSLIFKLNHDRIISSVEQVAFILDNWTEISNESKTFIADNLCQYVLDLGVSGNIEGASLIREKLHKCFLPNGNHDCWDQI